jgi:hypothetical protein
MDRLGRECRNETGKQKAGHREGVPPQSNGQLFSGPLW